MMTPTTPTAAPLLAARDVPQARSEAVEVRRLSSAQLLGTHREIEIEHGRATYRLRLTSLGKLILTK